MKTIGTITSNGFLYTIDKSDHLYEKRGKSNLVRDHYITDKLYIDIIKESLKQGLSSFRGKKVVVSFHDTKNSSYSILINISNDRVLQIITVVIMSNKQYFPSFIKIRNRVNLWYYYILPKLNKIEKNKRTSEINKFIIDKNCKDEDREFMYSMDGVKRI